MDQSPAEQLVGAVFNGRYRLLRLLGEGGMGAVYEARALSQEQSGYRRESDGAVALKVLHPEFCGEEQIVQRFFTEAQACQMLQHANVAQIYEAARAEDGTPYLVMELLKGIPLSTFIQPGIPVPPQQAATIAWGILQALSLAHARGIVHRDLKPDNLFLVPDGRGNFLVKVLDFGIAKVMDLAGGMGTKTKTGILLGTPGYMSPEQIRNSKGVDARSDLWGVGIVLYEMMTGQAAFPAEHDFARLTAVLTQEVRPIAQVLPALSAWSPVFARALAKDPAQRFQSAAEMAQAITSAAQAGKSNQGRDWGTVVLSIPQPPVASRAEQTTAISVMPTPQGPTSQAPLPSHSHGAGRVSIPTQAVTPAILAPQGPVSLAPQAAHPSTHVSMQRPPGVGTIASQPPNVQVISARPIGYPLWLVVVALVCGVCIGLVVGLLLA